MSQHNRAGTSQPVVQGLVDTHCHLDGEVFENDLDSVLSESRRHGVTQWINVGFAPARWRPTIALAAHVEGMFHMLGLHPGHADEWSSDVCGALESLLTTTRPVAIGEIGLDFFRGETNEPAQRTAFEDQLDLAIALDLPAVIHMRAAENQVLDLIRHRRSLPPLVFHSFEGTVRLRDFVVEHGSTIGVGGLATRTSAADLRQVIRTIPLDQIVLETDSPYLIPKGQRGRRNTPGNLTSIARLLADVFGEPLAEVAEATSRNADRIFRLTAHHEA